MVCRYALSDRLFVCLYSSTAKMSEVKTRVQTLLNRHRTVFGNYRWTEFDDEFLSRHVESVSILDLEEMMAQVGNSVVILTALFVGSCLFLPNFLFPSQPLDLKSCAVSIYIFTLNEDGPSMLSLEEEELSAANHWLLPAGN